MDQVRNNPQAVSSNERTRFFVLTGSVDAPARTRLHLLIEGLRTFGGRLRGCPVWVFTPDTQTASALAPGLNLPDVRVIPLAERDGPLYYFTTKVHACAQAEALAVQQGVRSLVWLSPTTMVVNSPLMFDLAPAYDAALRPVHIKNVGLMTDEPLDDFWQAIFRRLEITDTTARVESFVDALQIRPYYNSHLFAIDPAQGVLRTWHEHFQAMIADQAFQSGPCQDERHQVFLHQAIWSALITKLLDGERIRLLPPEYSYPLHFHPEIPAPRRAQTLNDLVCPVYEGAYTYPDTLNGLDVQEPLKSWLVAHAPS